MKIAHTPKELKKLKEERDRAHADYLSKLKVSEEYQEALRKQKAAQELFESGNGQYNPLTNCNPKSPDRADKPKFKEKRLNMTDLVQRQIDEQGADQFGQHGLAWYREQAKIQLALRKKNKEAIKLSPELEDLISAEVCEWIIDGMRKKKILEKTQLEYYLTPYMADKMHGLASERLKEWSDGDFHTQRTLAIRRFEKLYNEAVSKGDLKTAKDIQVELVRLFGLNEPERHSHTIAVKPLEEYTQEEIEILLANNPKLLKG